MREEFMWMYHPDIEDSDALVSVSAFEKVWKDKGWCEWVPEEEEEQEVFYGSAHGGVYRKGEEPPAPQVTEDEVQEKLVLPEPSLRDER